MKIALHGTGKMGGAVARLAPERGHTIVASFDSSKPPRPGDLSTAEVIIDFSSASALRGIVETACEARLPLVIGSTGWSSQLDGIRESCLQAGIGVVHASNFSVGANVLFALAREAARLFSLYPEYESGLEERHHSRKKDSPSGTALRLAAEVSKGSDGKLQPVAVSSRAGSEPGLHTLFFDSPDDLVEISHRARGRDGFARGAILAAERIVGKSGFFSFEELCDFGSRES